MISTLRVGILALLLAAAAMAAEPPDTLASVLEQQRELEQELAAGETRGMTPRQLGVVRKAQREVFSLAEGKSSLDQMTIEDKIRLENALERINAQVKGGDRAARDAQEVCWQERRTGSTRKSTRCGTEAERDQIREGARLWMEKPSICVPPGC
jgi:hypothetical protein